MDDDVRGPYTDKAHEVRSRALSTQAPPRIPRDRPLTPPEVEAYMVSYIDLLEEGTEVLEQRAVEAALAEAEYRMVRARGVLMSVEKLGAVKEADGLYQAREELRARNVAEALHTSMQDCQRVRRTIADSLRTLAVNARADAGGQK